MTATYSELLGYREVAGLRTASGGRVRPGRLHRSGTPQFLTPADARALVADTGIRTAIDLRLPHEVEREGRGPARPILRAISRTPTCPAPRRLAMRCRSTTGTGSTARRPRRT